MKFEDMGMVSNESLANSSRVRIPSPVEETPMVVVNNNNNIIINNNGSIFKECLKNHAVSHGGHALDGCCEFLPVGPEGSIDALKCAVCNCHRNFHRKEAPLPPNVISNGALVPTTVIPAGDTYPPYNHHHHHAPPPPQYVVYHSDFALISALAGGGGGEDHDDVMDIDNGGGGSSSNSKKRFRTKFTPEQKEKMLAFAKRMDWRIQKQDDIVVEEFCNENGVKRRVLKVWMNNNKLTLGKKPSEN